MATPLNGHGYSINADTRQSIVVTVRHNIRQVTPDFYLGMNLSRSSGTLAFLGSKFLTDRVVSRAKPASDMYGGLQVTTSQLPSSARLLAV
ncbi:hypothetical protein PspLS_06665 [Pyricularia sp. CBS 133598]|nr:hypothetical protein PspLS_06665 [Pyricularia sp. CBS 133598]